MNQEGTSTNIPIIRQEEITTSQINLYIQQIPLCINKELIPT